MSKKDKDKMLAMCGLECCGCEAYGATEKDDDKLRKEVAKKWSREFGVEIKPEEIQCKGCVSEEGPWFKQCHVCEIRKCGKEKSVSNCSECELYACETITKFHKEVPDAKKGFDK